MIFKEWPDDYGEVVNLPVIYGLSRVGKVKQWQVEVTENDLDKTANFIIRHGYLGGKIQENIKIIKKGKNIGKSNETTPYEQALSEAHSQWKSQRDQNYELEPPDPNVIPRHILPMLANKYNPKKQNIKLPCYGQPKLNGVRCLNILNPFPIEEPLFSSRNAKIYETLSHLRNPTDIVHQIMQKFQLDGEIYKHGWSFQRIIKAVKDFKPYTPHLEYWLYDLATFEDSDKEDYDERYKLLQKITKDTSLQIKLTPTILIESYDDIKFWHDKWVLEGFEGIILRNIKGEYIHQYRSSNLLKYKEFKDKEFIIVGAKEGEGLEAGCVVWLCETEDGMETFSVRPKGTRELRREWFIDYKKYLGEKLTVRYQERSEDNVPIFPVGIVIRNYE